ncbi:FAD-dependent oxidoreductase [Mycolicibacterium septicum DSM 44393]|uniref:FAD-dependent oxidoreductase n=1 Tax=Mycolicibacterium septicum DSM 44393 TaxID=1341646 RepID=A0A7X6S002_9MYCO|nr:FAD-dependent oxidoreductase [Mycolicibacterium septicum]NKZ15325.1 FAD-dependent oxidoreductase [Mycolicibacterium septicum DSM 44393]
MTTTAADSCDVCIVGAGLCGMNALFVASRYLRPDQKIILIDRRPRVGGMWVDTYPYVRLHQPHPMFTAGDIKWTLGREPSYLATKPEVLDHFAHCLQQIEQRVRVEERFGWSFEKDEPDEGGVRVTCRDADGQPHTVRADRLIKAYGVRVTPNDALELSSDRVRSVSPDSCDVRSGEIHDSDTPVWVIGSGKTAMDTAHALIGSSPGREVNMVAGSGTFFSNRDQLFPVGARRWWGGVALTKMAIEMTRLFDGTNEDEVAGWYQSTYGTYPTPRAAHFLAGVLSEAENAAIAAGLNDVVMDHLVDVVDSNGSADLVLRSGARKTVSPGSWIVNCTGYLSKGEYPYEPYVSGDGSVLSLQMRSATMHLTSYAAYFATHLMFLGKLNTVPLYELDIQDLVQKSKKAVVYAMFTLAQYNLSLITDAVPVKVFRECGLDFNRWYPMPRQLSATSRFLATHHRDREHLRRTLDTVGERFDVRCGPLITTSAAAAG